MANFAIKAQVIPTSDFSGVHARVVMRTETSVLQGEVEGLRSYEKL
jgi:hypothetical protein